MDNLTLRVHDRVSRRQLFVDDVQARVLALCETGSHVLWRWLIKPYHRGEVTMAHRLLRDLGPDMLLLWDRNFLGYQTVAEVGARKTHLRRRGLGRWYHDLVAEVAEEVLPARRDRINPRVIKRKISNWKKKPPEHRRYPQPNKGFCRGNRRAPLNDIGIRPDRG